MGISVISDNKIKRSDIDRRVFYHPLCIPEQRSGKARRERSDHGVGPAERTGRPKGLG